jgi:hypothetical protein
VQAQSQVVDLECHHNDVWEVLARMDEWMGDVHGCQEEARYCLTGLEHASWGPDAWTVVEEWERGVEVDEDEGSSDGEVAEEAENTNSEVDGMEDKDKALCWVRANPMQKSSIDK